MKVILTEKKESGELIPIDSRTWNTEMFASLQYANYLMVGGKEYEMLEGRLNVDQGSLELLVVAVKSE